MALERHTGASPETYQSWLFDKVCGDVSLFHHTYPFFMQTLDGSGVDSNPNSVNPRNDARQASNANSTITSAQAEILYLIDTQGSQELARSLRMIHDMALYHSDIPCDEPQKSALYDLKLLWESFERMEVED